MHPAIHRSPVIAVLAVILVAGGVAPAAGQQVIETELAKVRVTTVVDGLVHPWSLAFLPDGTMLVTERPGRLRTVSAEGRLGPPVTGVPEVDARGQGGLLDVALHPDFARNRLVYLSYAEPGEGGNGTAVARGRLSDDARSLSDVEVIFRQQPKVRSTAHFGSRLVFDSDGDLWVTLGERSAEQFRVKAQDLDNHFGKVVRLHDDGSVPKDNPFVGRAGALPEIWSYGHRNPQGAALHPETGELWVHEHGPRGGDEINVPEAGKNYGWPVFTYGREYSGAVIFAGDKPPPGMEPPLHNWTPSIAPSGMAFYSGELFTAWQGDLFVGALVSRAVHRLRLDGRKVVSEERMLAALNERIRDVRTGPDGALYLLTDAPDGRLLRIVPAQQ